jgi:hypothetical protein
MKNKTKGIIRKIIYFVLIGICIYAFIFIGNKYADNGEVKSITINDYYSDLKYNNYEVVNATELISLLRKGNNIIFIGSNKNEWSIKYMEEIDIIFRNYDVDKVYYYDLVNDKAQKNSNYYKIISLLKGYLVSTDSSDSNLFAPALYIVDDGKVVFYNIDTVAMRNEDTIDDYWTKDVESLFQTEVSYALLNYYLNN